MSVKLSFHQKRRDFWVKYKHNGMLRRLTCGLFAWLCVWEREREVHWVCVGVCVCFYVCNFKFIEEKSLRLLLNVKWLIWLLFSPNFILQRRLLCGNSILILYFNRKRRPSKTLFPFYSKVSLFGLL